MSWNPLTDLMLLQDRMNQLFEDASERRARREGERRGTDLERPDWHPLADVYENDREFIVAADLPGIDRSQLEITLADNQLSIRGKRQLENKPLARPERPGGMFHRTFTVPKLVDQDSIQANYRDGVLEVHLPKRRDQEPRKVEIKIT